MDRIQDVLSIFKNMDESSTDDFKILNQLITEDY